MIRKGLVVSAVAAAMLIGAAPASASVTLAATGGIIDQLYSNSSFSANNMQFTICQNGSCQTLFTGITGLHNLTSLQTLNAWANTGSYAGAAGYYDNYQFTFGGVSSFFGDRTPQPQSYALEESAPPPVPEPTIWALMIGGFAIIGMALRRRNKAAAVSFG